MRIELAAAALLIFGTACATSSRPKAIDLDDGTIQIRVDNRNFNDARIIAVTRGGERRLGIVQGKTERDLTLPWETWGTIALRVQMLAGDTFTTPELETGPGELLELTIGVNVRGTTIRR
jgi:hypothetical protein